MTTIDRAKKKCALCGETSKHLEVMSTNTFGGKPDLDTRPPEMMRSTMGMWVQECPACGYCSPDISEESGVAAEVVQTESYKERLKSKEFPELTNRFLCRSVIEESSNELAAAGWSAVYAAWACDDADAGEAAKECRERAVGLFKKAIGRGDDIAKDPGGTEAVLADLLRRSGKFELALEYCEQGLKRETEGLVEKILRFEIELINKLDVGCYTTAAVEVA